MEDFKLRGYCSGCKHTRWMLRKHETTIASVGRVKGRVLLCKKCRAALDKIKQ